MKKLTGVAAALISVLYLSGCDVDIKLPEGWADSPAEEPNNPPNDPNDPNDPPGEEPNDPPAEEPHKDYVEATAFAGPDELLVDYFDIEAGAAVGTPVLGKVQVEDNYRATFLGEDFADYSLTISDSSVFELEEIRTDGRLEGQLKVAEGATLTDGDVVELTVKLLDSDGAVQAEEKIEVNVVAETQWKTYLGKLTHEFELEERTWGKRYTEYSDVSPAEGIMSAEAVLTMIEDNDGKFTDLPVYGDDFYGSDDSLVSNKQNGLDLREASARIGGLGYALKTLDTIYTDTSPEYAEAKERLVSGITKAVVAFEKAMPLDGFDDSVYLNHSDKGHQWRFTDALTLPLVQVIEDLWTKADEDDAEAIEIIESFRNIFQISFSLLETYRGDTLNGEPLNQRYFMEKDLSQSPGANNDANRGHRMRTWSAILAAWRDYNRPITDKQWWYDYYKPFGEFTTCGAEDCADVTIQRKWKPKGSFKDLKTWIDTNRAEAYQYGQSGLLPDGSISHHIGTRQDLAMFAYGYIWMTEPLEAAHMLKGTPWEAGAETIDNSLEFMVKSMAPVIYKNGHDYQATGRSFMSKEIPVFGTERMVHDINDLLELGKDLKDGSTLSYQAEAETLKSNLQDGTHDMSGNFGFWNTEFMVHRRDGSEPWYASWRSQSIRVRGAESFKKDQGFHNGSGSLQVKVTGAEYGNAREDFDWHLQSGVTEEWRTDKIPLQSKDADVSGGISIEEYAGQNSDGENGLASFDYSTKMSYASAKAQKSAFFSDLGVLAIGDEIERDVKVGNNASKGDKPIVTTVEQALWSSDLTISYDGTATEVKTKGSSLEENKTFTTPIWIHQGDKGYIIWPQDSEEPTKLTLIGGDKVTDTYTVDTENATEEEPDVVHDIFAILLDHGVNPDANSDDYQYLVLPNVTAADMPDLYTTYTDEANFIAINKDTGNGTRVYGAVWTIDDKKLIQLAFRGKGNYELLKEYSGSTGKNMRVTVEEPLLVMLTEGDSDWTISVSDPTHHGAGIDPDTDEYSKFIYPLKDGANEKLVKVNWKVEEGDFTYPNQGYKKEDSPFAGQDVSVVKQSESSKTREITFSLPDMLDDEAYGLRAELYAGMSAVVTIGKE